MSRWVVLSLALWLIAAPGSASDAGVAGGALSPAQP